MEPALAAGESALMQPRGAGMGFVPARDPGACSALPKEQRYREHGLVDGLPGCPV